MFRFYRTLVAAAEQSLAAGEIDSADLAKIKRLNRRWLALLAVRKAVADEAMSSGQLPRGGDLEAIDWDAILAFIEKLIPLILQLISLFG